MKLSTILKKEIEKSNNIIVLKKVPKSKQPTFESLMRADKMMASQDIVTANYRKKCRTDEAFLLQ